VQQCRQRAPVSVVDTVKLRQRGQLDDDDDDQSPPTSGYLSNYVTELTGCGNIDSPWRVRALPGQRVNLTLIDFGVGSMSAAAAASTSAAAADSPRDRSSTGAVSTVCQANHHPSPLRYNCNSTSIRRPFDCLSKGAKGHSDETR